MKKNYEILKQNCRFKTKTKFKIKSRKKTLTQLKIQNETYTVRNYEILHEIVRDTTLIFLWLVFIPLWVNGRINFGFTFVLYKQDLKRNNITTSIYVHTVCISSSHPSLFRIISRKYTVWFLLNFSFFGQLSWSI